MSEMNMKSRMSAPAILGAFFACESEPDLIELLNRTTWDLGFEYFAMGHHVDLINPPDVVMCITNYDPEWIERVLSDRFFIDDPVHHASTRTAIGFRWSDVHKLIPLTDRQKMILRSAGTYGLREGYTIPVHVPGEYRGTCSFGGREPDRLRSDSLPIANLVGIYAFEAARKIIRRRSAGSDHGEVPRLTERQRDTLVLVGRGKADGEIATLMGISRATAHEHVENVRRIYGYAQRPNLIARALFDGQISFSEVLTARRLRVWS
jgi:LuxR family transcriptional regulator, quorum-sensing system regulator CciR